MSTPHRVKVSLPEANSRGYEVLVGSGLFASLATVLSRFCPAHRYAVVTDEHEKRILKIRFLFCAFHELLHAVIEVPDGIILRYRLEAIFL